MKLTSKPIVAISFANSITALCESNLSVRYFSIHGAASGLNLRSDETQWKTKSLKESVRTGVYQIVRSGCIAAHCAAKIVFPKPLGAIAINACGAGLSNASKIDLRRINCGGTVGGVIRESETPGNNVYIQSPPSR